MFPVYWMINTSFQPNAQVRGSELHFWPDNGTLENYANVIFDSSRAPFPPALANSLAVTLITVVVSLVFAFLAALAVTRFRFRSRPDLRTTAGCSTARPGVGGSGTRRPAPGVLARGR